MRVITEKVGDETITVYIGRGALKELSLEGKKVVIYGSGLTNDVRNYLHGLQPNTLLEIDDGERSKNLQTVLSIIDKLIELNLSRRDTLIAVGGGTVTDVVGFIASIYKRGINLTNVPTTLLGMVDASLGGKNGIDYRGIKNLIGTFYQPKLVLEDLRFLDSLEQKNFRQGLAEVIKYGITLNKRLYDYLSNNSERILQRDEEAVEEIIASSVESKLQIVSSDERERIGIRSVLNFGHTVGHVIESLSGFSIHHGMAVAVGMVCEAEISEELGIGEEGVVEDTEWILSLFGLPLTASELNIKGDPNEISLLLSMDKKGYGDKISLPLPVRIGSWKRVEVEKSWLEKAIFQCLT
ncbi:3-dehydroquinate synthase [Sulfolobales archaeon HS-7]|nr:3-dehydroquinate synthase [Sulfolobales archaeon HS-7]